MRNRPCKAIRFLAAAIWVGWIGQSRTTFAAPQTNVVVIVADDLGYADIGAQGVLNDIKTPNIDSIAAHGVRFTNGYVSCPVCSPSRAGFLTGRYQERFGHEHNPVAGYDGVFGLPVDQTTIADEFKRAGYATGALGKWHEGNAEQFRPQKRGFDEFYGFLGGMHTYRGSGKGDNAVRRGDEPVEQNEYLTDVISREAVSFIDRHKTKPFFLDVAYNAVHVPQMAPQKYQDRFADVTDKKRKMMLAMLSAEDDGVGEILAKLRDEKLENDTLVIFFSDNGGPTENGTSNKPLRGYKGQMWEGGIRIPYMMQWPGHIPPGRVLDDPVISLDLFPTALAAAKLPVPSDKKLDGVNLLPRVTDNKDSSPLPKRALYWRFSPQWAIRDGDLKLVTALHAPLHLFDVAKDPGETHDLLETIPDEAKRLQAEYDAWDKQLMAPRWPGRQEGENQAKAE